MTSRGAVRMWSGDELDAAERRIDEWQAGFDRRATQAAALSRRIVELTATARSDDRLVEVTVASSGVVTELRLGEGIRHQSAARTARQIMAVIGAAQAALTRQVTKATAETIGLHDPAGRAIVDGFTDRFGSSGQGDSNVDR